MKTLCTHILQPYRSLRLQTKFALALILVVTLPTLLFGFLFYSRLYDMVVSYTIQQEQDASAKTYPFIEDILDTITDTAGKLSELPFFQTLFQTPVTDSLSSLLSSPMAREFQEQADALADDERIASVKLYIDAEDGAAFTVPEAGEVFAPVSQIRGTYWYGIFQGQGALSGLYCPSFYLGEQERARCGDMAYIQKLTLSCQGSPIVCYAAVYFSSEPFTRILTENLSLDGSVSYIVNERDALVASSDPSLSGIYWLSYESIEDSVMSSNNFIERTILNETVYAGFYRIRQTGWYMVTVLPSGPLIQQGNELMVQYVHIYFAFLIFAVIFANILARSVTNRISSVIRQMRQVREKPPVPMESPTTHDEIGDLIDTYNYMTETMAALIEDQRRAAEDLRIAEFNSLQAQINPHFLYNTMDMINWLAQQGRTGEISSAVQSLSRFYKLTLSRKNSISTIAQEEEHASIYVHLQNMRYHDSITFVSDIPDELMEYQIPKLTLQPVIENAVLHGILEKDSKSGTIVLTGWVEDEDIVLLISDDGVGIPPEKLSGILSESATGTSKGNNIAVYNTHRRMQILYGSGYGLSYSSQPGQGTEVQIRIPAQKEYESPYLPSPRFAADRSLSPLVSVSDRGGAASDDVAPETLLRYSQKLTQNLYNVRNLHKLSSKLPKNENLYILTHTVTSDFPSHTHDHFELNYVCSGSLQNIIDGKEIYMTAGDLVFLNRKAIHALQYQQPNTLLINFCLFPEIFRRTLDSFSREDNPISAFFREESGEPVNYMFYSLGHSLQAQSILTSIIQEYADHEFHQSFSLEAYFLLLFSYLSSSEEYSYSGTDMHTHEMIAYLQRHCLSKTPEDIAEHFQLTAAQLEARLKKKTGRSMDSFIQEERMRLALRLLEDPKLNIYQIIQTCGYTDAEEFFRVFQERFHISPSAYREQFL